MAFPAIGDYVKYEFIHHNNDGTLKAKGIAEMEITGYNANTSSYTVISTWAEDGSAPITGANEISKDELLSEEMARGLIKDCKYPEELQIAGKKIQTCMLENRGEDIYYRAWFAIVPWGRVKAITLKAGIEVGQMHMVDFRVGNNSQ